MSEKNEEKKEAPVAPQVNQEEVKERVSAFLKDYGDMVNKHGVDFASYPVYVPDGQGGFKTVVQNTPVDIRNQPKKSPFIAQ